MSENTQSNDSTDSNQRIVLSAAGLARRPRYVDTDAMVERAIDGIQRLVGGDTENLTVVVKNNYNLKQALEDVPTTFDLEYYSLDWRMLLDDWFATDRDDNVHVDEDGEPVTRAIKEEDDPAASEFVDGDVPSGFSLGNREHRDMIDYNEVPEARIQAAKEKARLVASERLINDFYDYPEGEADGVVLLHSGSSQKEEEVKSFQGENRYVVNPERLDGDMLQVNLNQSGDQIVNWTLYLLESNNADLTVDDLSDSQKQALRDEEDEETLAGIGLETANEGVPTPAQAD